jgi:hypothetical protein
MVINIDISRVEATVLLGVTEVGRRFMRLCRIGLLGKLATISIVALGGVIVDRPAVAQPILATCATDDEIPPDKRATIEQAGLRFVQALVSLNTEAAYSELSSGAKQAVPRDKVAVLIAQVIQPIAPFSAVRVAQIHLVKVVTNASTARILCGSSLARPEDWVSVAVRPIAEQAHVLIDAQTKNNGWTFALWLAPEQDWRVDYFNVVTSTMVGKTAHDLWDLARSEQQSNRNFNAAMLYITANQLASRGPNFQLGITSEIQKDMQKLQLPPQLQGQAPFIWKFGEHAYKILNVGPIGVGGKIYLTLTQETAPWGVDQEADQQNRALISDFARAVPEYTNVFAGLVVGAKERGGNRLFRTVDETTAPAK